jgi:glycerophosphoryl diester phosphodiesterase
LIIGHRGASGYAPENTMAAIKKAINMSCNGLELDVQLTKDQKVIVHHDWNVDRTTNGKGEIKDLTLDDIRKLDAGKWYSDEFIGEKVPTLEEVLLEVPENLFLNIEIKSKADDNRGIEKEVIELLNKYNRLENTVLSSFNHLCLERIRKINPEIKIGILFEAYLLDLFDYIKKFKAYSIHPCNYYVSKELIDKAKDNNMKVFCWTVNDKSRAIELSEMGVDGIITNYPDLLKK